MTPAEAAAGARARLERFESLLDRAERPRGARLGIGDWRDLGRLYREHAARLARERQRGDDPDALRHLNALCVRAHAVLAVPPPAEGSLAAAFLHRLATAVGRTWRVQVAAWALLLLGMAVGAALSAGDPDAAASLVPSSLGYEGGQIERLRQSEEARLQFLERRPASVSQNALFGSLLFVHNTRVGLLSFATGILAGVPTILLQLYNGLILGAFGSMFLGGASTVPFLAWILPHGIPELTAITWCAAGGLMLGRAVAAPERRRRAEALREALDSAVVLLAGALPLFVAAALVESFVRESLLGTAPRLLVAAAMLAMLCALLWWTRRLSSAIVDTDWIREIAARRAGGASGAADGARSLQKETWARER